VYGIEAINAHNGWTMAIAGALIVMSGLSVLSFIISQLHKVLDLMDNGKTADDSDEPSVPAPIPAATVDHDLSNIKDSLSCYCDETAGLGSAFTLQDLFKVFQECDFPHPHLTIRTLKEEGYLVPAGEGMFAWNK
jgi:hypothetical protein